MTRALGNAAAMSSVLLCVSLAWSQQVPKPSAELRYVVVVSRHGVRSPTWTVDQLNQYSAEPWPEWGVAPGYLTLHGRTLIKFFGAYDRAYFSSQGLFSAAGCGDAGRTFFWADKDQRTIETAVALAEGMLPGCAVEIHSQPSEEADPLFNPWAARVGQPDPKLAVAAVLGRIGGNPQALLDLHRSAFEELERVLLGCYPAASCPPKIRPVEQRLLGSRIEVVPGKGDNLVDITGAIRTASMLTENFLLEYTNGMTGRDLGWGRLDKAGLRQVMALHTAYTDLARRTGYLARTRGSNLLVHVLDSLQQAVTGKPAPGAMGKPGDAALVIVGHDTNLSNLSGMLGLSWSLPGYQPDDTPPGGALVFELWRGDSQEYSVRTYYTAQSLEQMRQTIPLTMATPPSRADVFVPGCRTASNGFDCNWADFRRSVSSSIDPGFVKR